MRANLELEDRLLEKVLRSYDVDNSGTINYQVCRAVPSWMRSVLTEIYLCRTGSRQEILRVETPGQEFCERIMQVSALASALAVSAYSHLPRGVEPHRRQRLWRGSQAAGGQTRW
eukprot:COSAG01_NODE_1142_length_11533_cov_9.907381_17_plen_115_part_00